MTDQSTVLAKVSGRTAMASLAALLLSSEAALAHHVMDGKVPATFTQGLLSGLGHPVIGVDHFAYIVGLGIVAAVAGLGLALPALFVVFMCAGLALHFASINIPGAELMIAVSVILVGAAIVQNRTANRPGAGRWFEGGLFALAGTLHGYAFAESIVGAESTPLAAYIVGLVVVQLAIAIAAYAATAAVQAHAIAVPRAAPRLAGAAILLVGIYFAAGAAGLTA